MLLIYLLRLRHKQVQPPVRPPQRLDGLRALVAAQDELLVEREEGRERVALRRRQRGVPHVDGDEARAARAGERRVAERRVQEQRLSK